MTTNRSFEIPGLGLSFVLGIVLLSSIYLGWQLLVSMSLGSPEFLYVFLTGTGLSGVYVSLWRPHRVGIVVIPTHLGILFGYFGVVEWGYRTLPELAVVVTAWGLLAGITLLNADYFSLCGDDH